MKKLWLVFLIATMSAAAAPPTDFDARVEGLRRSIGVPGMAIAIVEEGKTTLARGYGVRKLGAATTVDADTLFPIGSTSKAMTVAALACRADREQRVGIDGCGGTELAYTIAASERGLSLFHNRYRHAGHAD